MSGSSWVLVVLVSKHRQVSLRRLDIDRSTLTGLLGFFSVQLDAATHRQVRLGSRCHQLSACCCCSTGLRCCTLKEKDVHKERGK